jgi:hypothetical protein
MKFDISVLNVQATSKPTAKGSYTMLDVAFKNLTSGKTEGKKIMSFTYKDVFDVLSKATSGQVFTITSEKNEKTTYWDWVAINTSDNTSTGDTTMASPNNAVKPAYAAPKSNYETTEERALRQVLIVRQSSLSSAIATLKADKKELDPKVVLDLAGQYSDWVYQKGNPIQDIADMEDDIPL